MEHTAKQCCETQWALADLDSTEPVPGNREAVVPHLAPGKQPDSSTAGQEKK